MEANKFPVDQGLCCTPLANQIDCETPGPFLSPVSVSKVVVKLQDLFDCLRGYFQAPVPVSNIVDRQRNIKLHFLTP